MSEDKDFFDELIDVDSETEEADESYSEDDDDFDEDDEDEPTEVRTVVLSKNGMIALLSLKTNATGGQIVRIDPRQSLPSARRYDDGEAANRWFKRSLAASRRNGWSVEYDGEPLFG